MPRRRHLFAASAAALCLLAAGCSSDDTESSAQPRSTITLYNAQHEDLMKEMVDGFTKETGIKVELRNGDDFELANQIIQEGAASPADVFVTENSPAMTLVDSKNGFEKLNGDAISQVPANFASPDGDWVGFASRATVFAYNSKNVPAAELPASIMDLAQPKWKDQIGFSPAGADFQAIVSAVLALKGEAATAEWLAGLKANAKVYRGNIAVMRAVNAGEIKGGIIYHYYWYKDRAESGSNSKNTELHFFGKQDPGAFVSVSGAGVVKASDQKAQAQQFVKYLNGPNGQKILADSKALEYTLNPAVPANSKLKPLAQLEYPTVDVSGLNGAKVTELMQKAGLL